MRTRGGEEKNRVHCPLACASGLLLYQNPFLGPCDDSFFTFGGGVVRDLLRDGVWGTDVEQHGGAGSEWKAAHAKQ